MRFILISFLIFGGWLYSCTDRETQLHIPPPDKSKAASGTGTVDPAQEAASKFTKVMDIVSDWSAKDSILFAMKKKATDPGQQTALADSITRLVMVRNNRIYHFIAGHEKNRENFSAMRYLALGVLTDIPFHKIDSVFHTFPEALKKTPDGKLFGARIKLRLQREDMQQYNLGILKLPFRDTAGNSITLEQISAKYLLLDFWASWCVPCRKENRELVKQTDLVEKNRVVAIVAVSLDDNLVKWKKATRADSLNYLTICDGKALDSPLAAAFKIGPGTGIPFNVLINKKGKILASNVWREDLLKCIASLP